MLPQAYIIPAEWSEIANRLRLHGVQVNRLTEPIEIKVKTYKFRDFSFKLTPTEGRTMVNTSYDEIDETRLFYKGSFVVPMDQRTAKIIAAALEPASQGSFLEWGFFNQIFEQKEYSESYVMETMARKMLTENPDLKEEFEKKMQTEEGFRQSPQKILNWFYSKTPYWDQRMGIYPVGKIYESTTISTLKNIALPVD
jgi:hypothetical protein